MKTISLFLIFLLSSTSSLLAINSDSLMNVWSDTSQTVKDRCNALNKIAWSIIRSDQDSAGKLAQTYGALARENDDYYLEAMAVNTVGVSYYMKGDYRNAADAYQACLELGEANDDSELVMSAYNNLSLVAKVKGDLKTSLNYLFLGLEFAEKADFKKIRGSALNNIATQYLEMNDLENAMKYAEMGLKFRREHNHEPEKIESSLSNIAMIHNRKGQYAEAYSILTRIIKSNREVGDPWREMQNLNNLAIVLQDSGATDEARNVLQEALALAREQQYELAEVGSIRTLAELDLEAGKYTSAVRWARRGLDIAIKSGMDQSIKNLSELSYQAYKALGREKEALAMYELYIEKRDSLNSTEVIRTGIERDQEYEYAQKALADSLEQERVIREQELLHEQEVIQERFRTQIAIVVSAILLILALVILRALQLNRRSKALIASEKQRSDDLLLNILPAKVATELKLEGKSPPRRFNDVTVLFTDFTGFTSVAAQLPPEELVALLDQCFAAFDQITQRYGIEKIKTIGDAYMCASGLPLPNPTHAHDVVSAALEIRAFVAQFNRDKKAQGKPCFEVRIGVHSGPVVAGIVGTQKFQYDIWGDTVNTASRMESTSEPGKINISGSTYLLIQDAFQCLPRGKVQVKGKGEIEMYFVEQKRSVAISAG